MLALIPEKEKEKYAWHERIGELYLLFVEVIRRLMAGKLDFYTILAQLKIWAGYTTERADRLAVINTTVEHLLDDTSLGAMLKNKGCKLGEETSSFKSVFDGTAKCAKAQIGLASVEDICGVDGNVSMKQIMDGIEGEGFLTCDFNEGIHFAMKLVDDPSLFNKWVMMTVSHNTHTGETVVIETINRKKGFFLNVRKYKKDGGVMPGRLVAYKIPIKEET